MQTRASLSEKNGFSKSFYIPSGLFMIFGYIVFLAATLNPDQGCILLAIEVAKPSIGALNTAADINASPLPIQATIIYSFAGSFILSAWFAFKIIADKEYRIAMQNNSLKQSRSELVGVGIFSLLALLPGWLYFMTKSHTRIGWQQHAFFSSDLASLNALLLAWLVISILMPFGASALCIAASRRKPRKSM